MNKLERMLSIFANNNAENNPKYHHEKLVFHRNEAAKFRAKAAKSLGKKDELKRNKRKMQKHEQAAEHHLMEYNRLRGQKDRTL